MTSHKSDLPLAVRQALALYLQQLDGELPACGIYDMLVSTVERPMLEVMLEYTQGNQSLCAMLLGINRNTLRQKLQKHGIVPAAKAPDVARKPAKSGSHSATY